MSSTTNRNDRAPRGRRRGLRILLLLAAAGAAGYWYYQRTEAQRVDPALAYRYATIRNGHIEDVVTAQGKLETEEYVDVGAQVSGQLKQLTVQIGDVVKKGELIAEIDPRVYQSRVQVDEAHLKTLQAQLAEQQAQVTNARQVYERNRRLIQSNATSQETLEASESAWKEALARVASIKAQIEEQRSTLEGDQTNLSYTKIYAPMDGTVVSQTAREGQTLNANQQAPVIVQLANLDRMTVRAQVAEADVTRLKPGTPVYFTTLGAQDRRWHGKVRQILPTPEVINDVVLYNALVDVDNRDRQLMSGMSAQMFFVLGEADHVPLIPIAALGKRAKELDNDQGQAYHVKVKNGQAVTDKIIHVGLMNRTVAEVRDGLAAGAQVVTTGPGSAAESHNRRARRPHIL